MSLFGFLAYILGPLMELMYKVIPNYGITIIVFTLLIRIVSFPLAINQQKSMAKMSVFTPMMNEIQQKYKNNQEKYQEEMMKFQQEYGYNPMSGCLPMALNMLVLFGIIEVVYRPLKYILAIPADAITTACEALGINATNYISQTQLIQAIHNGTTVATGLTPEQVSTIQNFNTSLFGLDVCTVPGLAFSPLIIFPVLATITMIISQIITTKMSGQQAQQQGSMKIMMWGMNAFFAYFCFTVPIGFSLYYTTSNLFQLAQSLIIGRVYSPERFKEEYAAEIAAKKAAKKAKKEVVIKENGKTVSKEVSPAELNRLRMERARALDAEKYADERTTPLNEPASAAPEAAPEIPQTEQQAAAEAAESLEELKKREDQ